MLRCSSAASINKKRNNITGFWTSRMHCAFFSGKAFFRIFFFLLVAATSFDLIGEQINWLQISPKLSICFRWRESRVIHSKSVLWINKPLRSRSFHVHHNNNNNVGGLCSFVGCSWDGRKVFIRSKHSRVEAGKGSKTDWTFWEKCRRDDGFRGGNPSN